MAEVASQEIQKYSTLVKLQPENPENHFLLGLAYENAGQVAESVKCYDQCIKLNPQASLAFLHRGFHLARAGDTDRALSEWSKAFELDVNLAVKFASDPHTQREYRQKIDGSIQNFTKPILINPRNAFAHYQLGTAYKFFNMLELSLQSLKRALDINARLWEAYHTCGEIYSRLEQNKLAISHFKLAVDANPRYADSHFQLAVVYERENQSTLALKHLEEAIRLDNEQARYYFTHGRVLMRQTKFKLAMKQIQTGIGLDKNNTKGFLLLAECCKELHRPDLALVSYEKAVEQDPDFAQAIYEMGTIALQLGQIEKAITSFERALDLNNEDPYAHYQLAQAYQQQGHFQEAEEHYREASRLNPKDAFAAYNLGLVRQKLGRPQEALESFRLAVDLKPQDATYHLILAKCAMQGSDHDEAVTHLREAIRLNPNDLETNFLLADVMMQLGQFDEAIGMFRKVTEITPDSVEAHTRLAEAFFKLEMFDYSFESYQQALRLNSKFIPSLHGMGILYLRYRNKPSIAVDFFQQALEIDPGHTMSLASLGEAYIALKQPERALEFFERKLEENRENAEYLSKYADALALGGQTHKAIEELKRALQLSPESSVIRGTLARLYFQDKRYPDALDHFQRLAQQQPKEAEHHFFIGQIHEQLSDKEKAGRAYNEALQRRPDYSEAMERLEILYEGQEMPRPKPKPTPVSPEPSQPDPLGNLESLLGVGSLESAPPPVPQAAQPPAPPPPPAPAPAPPEPPPKVAEGPPKRPTRPKPAEVAPPEPKLPEPVAPVAAPPVESSELDLADLFLKDEEMVAPPPPPPPEPEPKPEPKPEPEPELVASTPEPEPVPPPPPAYLELAVQGAWAEALAGLEQCRQSQPESEQHWQQEQVRLFEQWQQAQEAARDYRGALTVVVQRQQALGMSPELEQQRMKLYQLLTKEPRDQGNFQQALALWQEALQPPALEGAQAQIVALYQDWAESQRARQDFAAALDLLEKANLPSLEGALVTTLQAGCQHWQSEGDYEQAIDYLRRLAKVSQPPASLDQQIQQLYQTWASYLQEDGQAEAAQEVYARLEADYPGSRPAPIDPWQQLQQQLEILRQVHDLEGAWQLLGSFCQAEPQHEPARQLRQQLQLERIGQLRESEDWPGWLALLGEPRPELREVAISGFAARAQALRATPEQALEWCQQWHPWDAEGSAAFALELKQQWVQELFAGQAEKGLQKAEELGLHQLRSELQQRWAQQLLASGQFSQALEQTSNPASVYEAWSQQLQGEGDFEESLSILSRWWQAEPNSELPQQRAVAAYQGWLQGLADDSEALKTVLGQALASPMPLLQGPEIRQPWADQLEALNTPEAPPQPVAAALPEGLTWDKVREDQGQGRWEEALTQAELLQAADPNPDSLAQVWIAQAHHCLDLKQDIAPWLDQIRAIGPLAPETQAGLDRLVSRSQLGEILKGDVDKAEETLRELMARDPAADHLHTALYQLHSDSSMSGRRLVDFYRDLQKSYPNEPSFLLQLARAYCNAAKDTLAVVQYRKLVQVSPSAIYFAELAATYVRLDKAGDAQKSLQSATELDASARSVQLVQVMVALHEGDLAAAVALAQKAQSHLSDGPAQTWLNQVIAGGDKTLIAQMPSLI